MKLALMLLFSVVLLVSCSESQVCDEENTGLQEIRYEEICLELSNTRGFETSLRFQIAQKHGFGPRGADFLAEPDNIAMCRYSPGMVLISACIADNIGEFNRYIEAR